MFRILELFLLLVIANFKQILLDRNFVYHHEYCFNCKLYIQSDSPNCVPVQRSLESKFPIQVTNSQIEQAINCQNRIITKDKNNNIYAQNDQQSQIILEGSKMDSKMKYNLQCEGNDYQIFLVNKDAINKIYEKSLIKFYENKGKIFYMHILDNQLIVLQNDKKLVIQSLKNSDKIQSFDLDQIIEIKSSNSLDIIQSKIYKKKLYILLNQNKFVQLDIQKNSVKLHNSIDIEDVVQFDIISEGEQNDLVLLQQKKIEKGQTIYKFKQIFSATILHPSKNLQELSPTSSLFATQQYFIYSTNDRIKAYFYQIDKQNISFLEDDSSLFINFFKIEDISDFLVEKNKISVINKKGLIQFDYDEKSPQVQMNGKMIDEETKKFQCKISIMAKHNGTISMEQEQLDVEMYKGITPDQFTSIWIKIFIVLFGVFFVVKISMFMQQKKIKQRFLDIFQKYRQNKHFSNAYDSFHGDQSVLNKRESFDTMLPTFELEQELRENK